MRWLPIFIVVVIFLIGFYGTENIPEDKQCEKVDDCTFVSTQCCPGCEDFNPVNKDAAKRINTEFEEICPKECPYVDCESDTGHIIVSQSACVDNACSSVDELSCNAVCSYASKLDRGEPFSSYLQNAAQNRGMEVEALISICC